MTKPSCRNNTMGLRKYATGKTKCSTGCLALILVLPVVTVAGEGVPSRESIDQSRSVPVEGRSG